MPVIPTPSVNSPQQKAWDRYYSALWDIHLCKVFAGKARGHFGPSRQQYDWIDRAINDTPGDELSLLAIPAPGVWQEIVKRAEKVSDPEREYDFTQTAIHLARALEQVREVLKVIINGSEAIEQGLKYLDAKGVSLPELNDGLDELDRLLSAVRPDKL